MTENYRILIAGTDPELTAEISDALEKEQYQVCAISDMSVPEDPFVSFQPDMIILDPALTGSDPKGYLQSFWEKKHVPVLVVSSETDISSRVLWLEMGADDYLVKPFDMRELAARIHALQRSLAAPLPVPRIACGHNEFRPGAGNGLRARPASVF
jgi:DNA-binding response OmpR family regulator